jgi:hypothetical protein
VTDKAGRFEVEGIFEPAVDLLVTRVGCADVSVRVPLAEGRTVHDVVLGPIRR